MNFKFHLLKYVLHLSLMAVIVEVFMYYALSFGYSEKSWTPLAAFLKHATTGLHFQNHHSYLKWNTTLHATAKSSNPWKVKKNGINPDKHNILRKYGLLFLMGQQESVLHSMTESVICQPLCRQVKWIRCISFYLRVCAPVSFNASMWDVVVVRCSLSLF